MSDPVKDLVDACENRVVLGWGRTEFGSKSDPETGQPLVREAVAIFEFSRKGFGFGEITVVGRDDGKTYIDGETMNRATILSLFAELVAGAYLDTEQDPERRAEYDRVMRDPRPLESPEAAMRDMRWLEAELAELREEAAATGRGPWVQERIEQLLRELA